MRRTLVGLVKDGLHRYGYDLVRLSRPNGPPPDLEFPVDFDEETVAIVRSVQGFTMTGPEKLFALCAAVRNLVANQISGAIVECGVWKGGSLMAAARTLLDLGVTDRQLYGFDTFEGMPEPSEEDVDIAGVSALEEWRRFHHSRFNAPARAGLDEVRSALASTGYPEGNLHLIKGKVEDTIPAHSPEEIALLRLDTDYYESTRHELLHLYPRVAAGGVVIIDDYGHFHGARKAVDEYLRELQPTVLLHRIDYSGRVLVKS